MTSPANPTAAERTYIRWTESEVACERQNAWWAGWLSGTCTIIAASLLGWAGYFVYSLAKWFTR